MRLEKTEINDVVILEPDRYVDERGFFSESYNHAKLAAFGIDLEFCQDNHSLSARAGTIRGLHFQRPPHAQAKLVRCGQGCLFDVAVDIRKDSRTFGKWVGVELSSENGKQLLIPAGFLHGFITLVPNTEVVYKCTNYFAPDYEGSVRFDDPDLSIDWPVEQSEILLSEKDSQASWLRDLDNPF